MNALKGYCFVLFCCLASSAQAQYYYQDIYNTQATNRDHALNTKLGVRKIDIMSYDVYHSINQDFTCTKTISDDHHQVISRTGSLTTGTSVLISTFDDQNRIIQTTDSTAESVNRTLFYYDSTHPERLDSLVFSSIAIRDKDTFQFNEQHLYHYSDSGRLEKMIRRKNGQDYSEVTFSSDSSGQIIKEQESGKYASPPPRYYKYDSGGRLTDVFHYNPNNKKMEPDFLFDYDEAGKLSEKTTVVMNTHDYLLWVYSYNGQGLIDKQTCYGKKHALQGSLEYRYTF